MGRFKKFLASLALVVLLFTFAAPAQAQATTHSVVLTWTASTDAGSAYSIFRLVGSCPTSGTTGFTQIGTVAAGIVTYTDSGMAAGAYCYYVQATLSGQSSKPSNLAPANVIPGSVTITVTVAS